MVQYTGSKADREVIRKHEFYFANSDKTKKKRYKFDVLLVSTSFVIFKLCLPCCLNELACINLARSEPALEERHPVILTGAQHGLNVTVKAITRRPVVSLSGLTSCIAVERMIGCRLL